MKSHEIVTGFAKPASLTLRDALDAPEEAGKSGMLSSVKVGECVEPKQKEIQGPNPICRICGKPSERKRRRDHSWFYYDRCRRCRRETVGGKSPPARIRDGRLLYLIEILEEHLLRVKEANWQNAPKRGVGKRLRSLIRVLEE